jgi:hypothetical protein
VTGLFLRTTIASVAIASAIACAVVATIVEASERGIEITEETTTVTISPDDAARIHAVLLSLQPWHGDVESRSARRIRLGAIAIAIASVSRGDRELAALLIEQGRAESHYAEHVHAGRCGKHPKSPPGECDRLLARSPWQVHRPPSMPLAQWDALRGSSLTATTAAASLAARALRQGRASCGGIVGPMRGAVSLAATGSSCRWPGAEARAARARRWMVRL